MPVKAAITAALLTGGAAFAFLTSDGDQPPPAPSNLRALSGLDIFLSWERPQSEVTNFVYVVYESANLRDWTAFRTLPNCARSFTTRINRLEPLRFFRVASSLDAEERSSLK